MHEGSQKLRRLGLAVLFALAASATEALSQSNPACGVPAALGDGWIIDSPESAGLDGARLPFQGNGALDALTNFIIPSVRDKITVQQPREKHEP
jgi:hypothetical protein